MMWPSCIMIRRLPYLMASFMSVSYTHLCDELESYLPYVFGLTKSFSELEPDVDDARKLLRSTIISAVNLSLIHIYILAGVGGHGRANALQRDGQELCRLAACSLCCHCLLYTSRCV